MIFLVSGEGPSDIGTCTNQNGECKGADFRAGPMAVMVDMLIEEVMDYSLRHIEAMECVSEGNLAARCRDLPLTLSAGKKRGYETAYPFKAAWALGRLAKGKQEETQCPVGAVLFRDTDGTQAADANRYQTFWTAVMDGFSMAEFRHGVPMIPKPKSEAWMICALKQNPYQQCAGLETSLSGNDNAPNSAKDELGALLAVRGKQIGDLSDMVECGEIDPRQIDMPSYNHFRDRLIEVAKAMISQ